MKTLLLIRAIISFCFVCVVTVGFGQENELHPEEPISRTNVTGYGTSLITYQLSSSVIYKDAERLKTFIGEFDGVSGVRVDDSGIAIQFDEVKYRGQVDLLFERMEMLYLVKKTTP